MLQIINKVQQLLSFIKQAEDSAFKVKCVTYWYKFTNYIFTSLMDVLFLDIFGDCQYFIPLEEISISPSAIQNKTEHNREPA